MQKVNHLRLLTDEALGEGNDQELDGLGFSTYSRVLGDAAIGTSGPFTIGVFGEWGTGKTSLMRMIQSYLSRNNGIITVWFNAWRYEQEEHPIVPLVATIVREVERNRNIIAKLADGGNAFIKALRAVAYGFSAKSKVKLPGFAEIEASFVAKEMIDRSDVLTPDPLLDRSLYYEAFEQLSSIPIKEGIRIVVLVDDLDRCFPDLAIRLLESIKLVLSQPGFIFVLGVARSVIEGYLQHRYQDEFGIKDFQGQSYLDKIVQLPFHIPSHRGRMSDFSRKVLERIDPEVRNQFESVLPIIGAASGSNPRSTVRFVNNLLIDIAINKQLAHKKEMTEISLDYFAVTRCLQLRWPQVFSILISSSDISTAVSNWGAEDYRKEASSEDEDIASVAVAMLGDKDLQKLLNSKQGRNWLTNTQLRDASVEFLRTQRQEREDEIDGEKQYDVFFSYLSKDRPIVAQIAEYLTDLGLRVFIDMQMHVGDSITDTISSALQTSRAIAFCASEASLASEWPMHELESAFERLTEDKNIRIIPIMLPGSDFTNLPHFLAQYKALDLTGGISQFHLARLARSLRRK